MDQNSNNFYQIQIVLIASCWAILQQKHFGMLYEQSVEPNLFNKLIKIGQSQEAFYHLTTTL